MQHQTAPVINRMVTDEPDFRAYEAVILHRMPVKDHPWLSRYRLADSGLEHGAHFLRNLAHDPRLPRETREIIWNAHKLVWQARELIELAGTSINDRHAAERRRAGGR